MSSLLYFNGTNYSQNKRMNKETLQEQFKILKTEFEELRMKLQKTGEQFLAQNFKELFEKHPKLETISWSQYTPYYNDGENCVFRSNHQYAEIEGIDYKDKEYKLVEKELEDFMDQFYDELLMNLFGDHVQLTISKDGITVEEYEHE